ncbi:MAG TPA: guanine deaminase [Trueperaceae bacterium]
MTQTGHNESDGTPLLYRATVFHTPTNAFVMPSADALEAFEDGAVVVAGGRIVALGDFREVSARTHASQVVDLRPGYLLPGLVDTHVHYPQVYSVGRMGLPLLAWLERYILPDEMCFEDPAYAAQGARDFLNALVRNGTTTALVFGVHVPAAQNRLFETAMQFGYRLISGLVTSDRKLLPAMHKTPDQAQHECAQLIERWHGQAGLRYALTPRFAVSASDRLLAALGELLESWPDLYVQTHLNETPDEVTLVKELFPHQPDYLATYETHGLVQERAVFAHDVHPSSRELAALAAAGAAVAHCPSSNTFLGSGLFPFRAHLDHGVRVGLGSDVAAGTSFNLLGEALAAYRVQMLQADGLRFTPAQLLYLATRAGAEALRLQNDIGDLKPGKAADMVLLKPPHGSQLEVTLRHRDGPADALGSLIALANEESVARVYLSGREVYRRPTGSLPVVEASDG